MMICMLLIDRSAVTKTQSHPGIRQDVVPGTLSFDLTPGTTDVDECTDLRVVGGQLDARTRSWLPRYVNLGLVWSLP
jgi:hypothetical protein